MELPVGGGWSGGGNASEVSTELNITINSQTLKCYAALLLQLIHNHAENDMMNNEAKLYCLVPFYSWYCMGKVVNTPSLLLVLQNYITEVCPSVRCAASLSIGRHIKLPSKPTGLE